MKIMIIVLSVIGGLAVLAGVFFVMGTAGLKEIKDIVINQVDLSNISDGTYEGSFRKHRWNYDLAITIKNHKIDDIEITNKDMGSFKDFNNKAIEAVIKKQSPQIDVVTGASVHTKAFSKAVENTLMKAQIK